jgi:diguanylate cyclase (GGDEF)-like protein/PAS domain S-box-containing protein
VRLVHFRAANEGEESRVTTMAELQDTRGSEAKVWWRRLHRALMPDYNRQTTAYWWITVLVGGAVLAHALHQLSALSLLDLAEVGAATAIAVLAGFFPFRVPRSKNSFTAGEVVIFLLLLLQGPAAATLAAAGEGLVGSWRTSKRWTSRIISPATASIAMLGAGAALQAATTFFQSLGLPNAAVLLLAMTSSALVYFLINTALITAVPFLKRGEWPTPAEMFGFGWVGISVVGSAPVACLLLLAYQQAGIVVLMVALPMAAMLLTTLHYFFRQQQANEAMRKHHRDAIAREAQLGARHVRELEASERRFHSAFTRASIGMALVSPAGRVVQANEALRSLLGLGSYESISQRLITDFVDAADVALLDARLARLNAKQVDSFSVELQLRHDEGDVVWAAVHGSFISDIESASPSLILQVQDVTARREAEARLQYIAFHDSLTGLPNRRRFQDDLEQALALAQAEPARHFSLMFLDFDRFKLVNDSLGHAIGDEFLIAVARRIQQSVRPKDIVARLGGDEFAILTVDTGPEGYAVTLAERLLAVLGRPFRIAGTDIKTSASIGITFSSLGYVTPSDMLRDADAAMYKAKVNGRARYAIFDTLLQAEVSHRGRLELDLRSALAAGEISVAYQPIFDLELRRITGFEALARWNHPELGPISPLSFIAIAEEAGLIIPLTDFMLRSACRQLREWHLLDDSLSELSIHVNVSGNDIAHRGLPGRVSAAIEEAQLQPRHLTLELTGNILIERLEAALPTLNELRAFGVGLSLDDFGSGDSSLRCLSALPVTSLKIDRGFVQKLQRGSGAVAVLRAIVSLGASLGKSIIAEGIESAEQMEQLRLLGCRAGQGYHLARPLAAELIGRMLAASISSARLPQGRERVSAGSHIH